MRSVAVVLLLSACFSPSFSSDEFKCVPGGQCPPGFVCASGVCAIELDLAMSLPDLAQRPDDLALSKPPVDMAKPACNGGVGTQVGQSGQDVWACPGIFITQSQQTELCGMGYAVCTTGINVDESACKAAGGFFLLDYLISYGNTSLLCGDGSGLSKELLGCGFGVTYDSASACQGLTGAIACQLSGYTLSGWSCTTGFADAKNTNAADGVLCCPTSPSPADMAVLPDQL